MRLRALALAPIARHMLVCDQLIVSATGLRKPAYAAAPIFTQDTRFSTVPDPGADQKSSWMPNWLRGRLPGFLGGATASDPELLALENMTLDMFASNLRNINRAAALQGTVGGVTGEGAALARAQLQSFVTIVEKMTKAEKEDLSVFDTEARRRVANEANCAPFQVDECIKRYLWMRDMCTKVAQLKREGKPFPKSPEEATALFGSWEDFTGAAQPPDTPPPTTFKRHRPVPPPRQRVILPHKLEDAAVQVPMDFMAARDILCGLAGQQVLPSSKCPLTAKKYKYCCGKKANFL